MLQAGLQAEVQKMRIDVTSQDPRFPSHYLGVLNNSLFWEGPQTDPQERRWASPGTGPGKWDKAICTGKNYMEQTLSGLAQTSDPGSLPWVLPSTGAKVTLNRLATEPYSAIALGSTCWGAIKKERQGQVQNVKSFPVSCRWDHGQKLVSKFSTLLRAQSGGRARPCWSRKGHKVKYVRDLLEEICSSQFWPRVCCRPSPWRWARVHLLATCIVSPM